MKKERIKSILESVLFVKSEPISCKQLGKIVSLSHKEIKEMINEMANDYDKNERGLTIIQKDDKIQLVSNPDNAKYVEKAVNAEVQKPLSRTALEVLSIIAYRSPIDRAEIEAIRGVNSSFALRSLLIKGLITRKPKKNDQRSYLYEISFEFLKELGLKNIKELPDYEKLSLDKRAESNISVHTKK